MDESTGTALSERGIRPSAQRGAILSLISGRRWHPTADDVYTELSPRHPTLSRTTVYNTLKLFASRGLVSVVRIEDDELRYDADTSEHAHFKCNGCGRIFDLFGADVGSFARECRAALPDGFVADEVRAAAWGKCADCAREGGQSDGRGQGTERG